MGSIILSQTRSSSMPSRTYPLSPELEPHLTILKSQNNLTSSSSSSSSLSSISSKLNHLEHVYDCVHNLLILPHTQQVFTRERNDKWVEEILDGYLGLVDASAMVKDFVSQSKEYISNILFVLRQRRDSDDLSEPISSRKTLKKKIQKSLRNMGRIKTSILALDKDQETIAIIRVLKETESITLELLKALLSAMAGAKNGMKPSRWSLVSRPFRAQKVSCQEHNGWMVEFRDLDVALCRFVSFRASKDETRMKTKDLLQQQLREMDLNIRVIEERLERLFNILIKARVSLLNMQSLL